MTLFMDSLRSAVTKAGRWTLLLPLACMCLIFCLSSLPGSKLPTWGIGSVDLGDFLHFPVYYGLGILWLIALEARRVPERKSAFLAVFFATLFGALDEVHQSFVPLRYMDFWDGVVNCAGATCAALTWGWLKPLFFASIVPREAKGSPVGLPSERE